MNLLLYTYYTCVWHQWMGGREVSRESFRHALKGGRSCLVVPGGQAEMLQSQSDDNDVSQILHCVI